MRRILAAAWVAILAAAACLAGLRNVAPGARGRGAAGGSANIAKTEMTRAKARGFVIPLAFEPGAAGATGGVQFVARGKGMLVGLGCGGMQIEVAGKGDGAGRSHAGMIGIQFEKDGKDAADARWRAEEKFPGETNYLIGRDASEWRTNVPRFGRAEAAIFPGVRAAAYGRDGELEYDLRVAPGVNPNELGLRIQGAQRVRLDERGDLEILVAGREMVMRRPAVFEEGRAGQREAGKTAALHTENTEGTEKAMNSQKANASGGERWREIAGGYLVREGGRVGFWVGKHDADSTVVIDPTLTLTYASFLGGPGGTEVNSAAVDSQGNLYAAGETPATGAFPGTVAQAQGVAGGSSYLFVAKLNPAASGAASLKWLTFIGGSGSQAGGAITVDANGNVVIGGTTTSADYPVTDGSGMKSGSNAAVVTEIDQATGAKLNFSSMLAGSGAEGTENGGGVGIDANGNIYVASDTTSADLCAGAATTTPFQPVYGGGATDGFLAMYAPASTPTLRYCTYLGIFAEVGVMGLAIDAKQNVFLAGFTSQPVNPTQFPSTANGFQGSYGGGDYDGFLVKIAPSGNGASDLLYATYLGGTGSDQAMAIAVDSSVLPATAYVVGTTDSPDFPAGAKAGYQTKLGVPQGIAGTNAFLAVVTQDAQQPATGPSTNLQYSTYLGGSREDQGLAVAELAANEVYVAGSANSTDFPWLDNMQPLNGDTDAFVAELDTTTAGSGGLKFATPLGGTPAPGMTATTAANSVAVANAAGGSGDVNVFVAGTTNALDFPQAPGATGTGVELTCASCPGAAGGFVTSISENPAGAAGPSLRFDPSVVRFASSSGYTPVNVGIRNSGDETLEITSVTLSQVGSDFSLQPASPCSGMTLAAGSTSLCSFQVSLTPTTTQTEGATILIADNAPGGTQVLQVAGIAEAPEASIAPGSLSFGNTQVGMLNGPQYVMIANTGGQALGIEQISVSSSAFVAQASGAAAGCTSVPAGGACVLGVSFKPSMTGAANATLTITDNSGNAEGTTQIVLLSGTGVSGGPAVTLAPATLGFGQETVGATSGPQSVTLTNSGGSTLEVSSISASGGAGFAIVAGGTGACPSSGGTIAAGASCTITMTFTPVTSGAASGSLDVFDNAGAGEQSVALSGTGTGTGSVTVTPTSISFAPESVGAGSAPTNVTVTNSGNVPLEFAAVNPISVTGTNAGDFLASPNCGSSLAAGKSCLIQVTFQPTAAGNRAAELTISDNATGSPQMVAMSGTATPVSATIAPSSFTFAAAQLLATASQAEALTLTNTGAGGLTVSKIVFGGTDPTDFSETDNCASGTNAQVGAGQSCSIQVTFKPQFNGTPCGNSATQRCATMTAMGSNASALATATLTGSVMDFEIAPPAGGSLGQTVTAGTTATYNLEIDSSGGFAGSVALTVSEPTAISGTSCSVTPASVSVTANGAGAFVVSVPTTAAGTAASWKIGEGIWKSERGSAAKNGNLKFEIGNLKWRSAEAVWLAMVCAVISIRLLRERRMWPRAAFLAAVLIVCASCGDGGSAATDPAATLSGTYTNAVTVTATVGTGATAVSRTAQLTLIVQ